MPIPCLGILAVPHGRPVSSPYVGGREVSHDQSAQELPDSTFSLSIPVRSLQPLIESVLQSTGCISGWPLGRIALNEPEAAQCIGVKTHVLRDARLRLRLPHALVGRTVTYTAEQLLTALRRMTAAS